MKRRKFLNTSLAASAIPLTAVAGNTDQNSNFAMDKELIEIRTYEMRFRGNAGKLIAYLNEVLKPALERKGITNFLLMDEMGMNDPKQFWVLISYPNASTYIQAQNLNDDETYLTAVESYNKIPEEQRIFNRYTSTLSLAFDGMPKVKMPAKNSTVFELRIYEGYSEDAVARKIAMFNDEEIVLFEKVGLHMVCFGDIIAGPHRPALVYMLHFKDMAERDANWKTFFDHPDWKAMLANPKYANTVSNIRRVFLKPA